MPEQWTAELIGEMHLVGVTAKQLAKEAGWHEKYLSAVMNGHRSPKGAEKTLRAALDRLIAVKPQNNTKKELGYIVLFSGNTVVGSFVVDGKVSSLNSYLTPDSEYYEYSGDQYSERNEWLADVDGSYGENDAGIFFFTPDGKYIEWTGTYLYSDIPFEVADPVVTYEVSGR